MRLRSNHPIDLLVASLLTLVGLMRVSIGPAISVMLLGLRLVAGGGHHRDGGERLHAGLADGDQMRARAQRLEKPDDVFDIVVEAEGPVLETDVARVVPIGDVDVVIGQQRAHGVAQQRGEVARQRRHDQHARLVASGCPS